MFIKEQITRTQDTCTGKFIFGNLHNDRYIVVPVVIKSMSIDETTDTNLFLTTKYWYTNTHLFSTTFISLSAYFLTPKITPRAVLYNTVTLSLTPFCKKKYKNTVLNNSKTKDQLHFTVHTNYSSYMLPGVIVFDGQFLTHNTFLGDDVTLA